MRLDLEKGPVGVHQIDVARVAAERLKLLDRVATGPHALADDRVEIDNRRLRKKRIHGVLTARIAAHEALDAAGSYGAQ